MFQMKVRKSAGWVLIYECVGFGLLIIFSWMDEFQGIAQLVFGGEPQVRDWRDCALQSLIIFYVWAIVFGLTKKVVDHLHYLEGFVRICAWCRKVGHRHHWMSLEEYLVKGFRIETTHGMCPDCLERVKEETAEFVRLERSGAVEKPATANIPNPAPNSSET